MNELLRNLLFLPEQRSTVARDIDTLHYVVILTSVAGAALVSLVTLYFLVRYHRRTRPRDIQPAGPDTAEQRRRASLPLWIEFGVAGGLLIMFIVWWVIGYRQYVHVRSVPAADVNTLDIHVTAKQWMWSFAYPDGSVSHSVLYVPEDRPIKLFMTSRDVIHSFYVPAFRLKQDVVPGLTTTMWFEATDPGRYDIFCTEYCGTHHSTMRGQVVVLSADQYAARLTALEGDEQRYFEPTGVAGEAEPASLARQGEHVASRYGCLRCHTVDGTPHIGPTFARAFGAVVPLAGGGSALVDEAYLTESMMDPLAKVHRDFQPVMPSYRGILSAAETGALVAFIRSLRDVPVGVPSSPLPDLERGDLRLVEPHEHARRPETETQPGTETQPDTRPGDATPGEEPRTPGNPDTEERP